MTALRADPPRQPGQHAGTNVDTTRVVPTVPLAPSARAPRSGPGGSAVRLERYTSLSLVDMANVMRELTNRQYPWDGILLLADLRHESGTASWGLWFRLTHPTRRSSGGNAAYIAGVGFHARQQRLAFTGQDTVCRTLLFPLFEHLSSSSLEEAFPGRPRLDNADGHDDGDDAFDVFFRRSS